MNRPTLVLLCGIPGAGKTYYAKKYIEENPNTIHLSSDSIRAELYGDESIQGNPNEVFSIMQQRAICALNNGQSVVYDCTSITRKDRAGIIAVCPKFAKIECHIIWAPIELCIERDVARERTVSKEVIDKMLKRFQAPFFDEGIDEIKVVLPDGFKKDQYEFKITDDMEISHDNPHHTLSIVEHCYQACKYADFTLKADDDVCMAAELHDIGKPYVKAFVDSKGNQCETAHYYQHQCVGSWMSYGIHNVTPYMAWLISTHMDPFLNTKYYKNLPAYLKNKIDLLHEADVNAH